MVSTERRRSKNRQSLNVWVNGLLAGTWHAHKNRPQEFQYTEAWRNSQYGRMLSLSMPFQPGNLPYKGEVVEHYFDNLLPDSQEIRRRIQQNYGAGSSSPFDLLVEIGRDCVGAIQLLPEDEEPTGWKRIEARPLDDLEVEHHLNAAVSSSLPGEERKEFRISIAGAQEKTALLWHQDQWHAPVGVTPTTHIMKLPLGLVGHMRADMSTSIENEWLCSKLVDAYGIDTAYCEMARFGDTKALVVKRFDRKLSSTGDYWLRLPQEDTCQALGLSPSLKYESDGGPGMADILELLRGSSMASEDRRAFYKAQILFWMLAATDGHAKNFSIFHEVGGTYRMAPLYDLLSAWPIIGHSANKLSIHDAKLAMAFRTKNAHYKIEGIYPRHFRTVAGKLGLTGEIDSILAEILDATPKVISQTNAMLPAGFPQQVAETIYDGLRNSARKISREA